MLDIKESMKCLPGLNKGQQYNLAENRIGHFLPSAFLPAIPNRRQKRRGKTLSVRDRWIHSLLLLFARRRPFCLFYGSQSMLDSARRERERERGRERETKRERERERERRKSAHFIAHNFLHWRRKRENLGKKIRKWSSSGWKGPKPNKSRYAGKRLVFLMKRISWNEKVCCDGRGKYYQRS